MSDLFKQIKANGTVIIGVSGGPDSIYLLHQVLNLPHPPHIVVAHINHKSRGKDSDADEKFVRNLAKKHQLIFESVSKKFTKDKGNFEENARNFRYQFFERCREKHEAEWILTAHHLNDQVETVLFNMARGSLLSGFQGINVIDQKLHLLRPLLETPKSEILKYLKNHHIHYRLDQSNNNSKFTRNRIRNEIIPEFEKINPEFLKTFASSLKNLQENLDLVSLSINHWINHHVLKIDQNLTFDLDTFLSNPEIFQTHILQKLFKDINKKGLTTKQSSEIQKTLSAKKSNRKKEFGSQSSLKIIKNPNTQKRVVVIEYDNK